MAAAEAKLTHLDDRARRATTTNLGIPTFSDITGRTASLPTRLTGPVPDTATAT